jgi:anti-sigma regulatory factor (Ser/Thr protein kinase)
MSASTCEVIDRSDGAVPVLAVRGQLDTCGASALYSVARTMAASSFVAAVWDLSEMVHPEGRHLLTVFPTAQRQVGLWPGRVIHLAGASAQVLRSLWRLRVDRVMPIHAARESAFEAAATEAAAEHRRHELPGEQPSATRARGLVDDLLGRSRVEVTEQSGDDIRLVVSELAGNAVRHARCPFVLSLALAQQDLLVAVTDRTRQEPVLRPDRHDAADGRGLQLVDALSLDWGVRLVHRGGKTVYARMPLSST